MMKHKILSLALLSALMLAGCAKRSDIASIKSALSDKQQDIENIQDQLSALLKRIQSITYVPKYSDGKAALTYTDNGGTFTAGKAVFDFELSPASAAAELAALWNSSTGSDAITMKAVYTITKAIPESVDLSIESVTAEDCYLTVIVSGSTLKEDFFKGGCSANARLKISDGNNDITTAYMEMVPMKNIVFSDTVFKDYCVKNFDTDGDGEISPYEAWYVTRIECSNSELTSLEGIEYFSNLKYLDVSGNAGITALALDYNTALETLDASSTGISAIDLGKNTALKTLFLSSTPLVTLDVSHNTSLATLDVNGCSINSLKISETLNCLVGQYVIASGVNGVIFSASSSVVKIMSTTETSAEWGYHGTTTGATSATDGAANTDKIASGSAAAKWCRSLGAEWYIPVISELSTIYSNKSELNTTLAAIGGTQLGTNYYWSSTEYSSNYAYYIGFDNGSVYYYLKSNSRYVRAVRTL